jgi:hypothetical protein
VGDGDLGLDSTRVEFVAEDADIGRGFDPDPHFVATHPDDGHDDRIADSNPFVLLP